jgi:hypothetical protein
MRSELEPPAPSAWEDLLGRKHSQLSANARVCCENFEAVSSSSEMMRHSSVEGDGRPPRQQWLAGAAQIRSEKYFEKLLALPAGTLIRGRVP